eukprot:7547120-Alexandrium_andersonii.AAC.1
MCIRDSCLLWHPRGRKWHGDQATQWALQALRNAEATMGSGLVRPVEPPDPADVRVAVLRAPLHPGTARQPPVATRPLSLIHISEPTRLALI